MASMVQIPTSEGFAWKEMANEQEQPKTLLTWFVEMLIPKASSQETNLISFETNLAMLVTQVMEKLIQRPSETLQAAKTKEG